MMKLLKYFVSLYRLNERLKKIGLEKCLSFGKVYIIEQPACNRITRKGRNKGFWDLRFLFEGPLPSAKLCLRPFLPIKRARIVSSRRSNISQEKSLRKSHQKRKAEKQSDWAIVASFTEYEQVHAQYQYRHSLQSVLERINRWQCSASKACPEAHFHSASRSEKFAF